MAMNKAIVKVNEEEEEKKERRGEGIIKERKMNNTR